MLRRATMLLHTASSQVSSGGQGLASGLSRGVSGVRIRGPSSERTGAVPALRGGGEQHMGSKTIGSRATVGGGSAPEAHAAKMQNPPPPPPLPAPVAPLFRHPFGLGGYALHTARCISTHTPWNAARLTFLAIADCVSAGCRQIAPAGAPTDGSATQSASSSQPSLPNGSAAQPTPAAPAQALAVASGNGTSQGGPGHGGANGEPPAECVRPLSEFCDASYRRPMCDLIQQSIKNPDVLKERSFFPYEVGTCGPYRYTKWGDGHESHLSFFDANDTLVGVETQYDVIDERCEGKEYYGAPVRCSRVSTKK